MAGMAVLARREGVRQIGVVLAAVGVYEIARLLMAPDWVAATANARRIVHVEDVLSLGWEQPLQHFFITTLPGVVQAMNVFYFLGHFVLTGVFFFWLYWTSRPAFRTFRDGFLVATAISVVVHWLYPTAPPRVAVSSITDTLWFFDGIDIGSPSSGALSNPVAAVPSLHAGYAVGVCVGLALYATARWLRALGVVYPFAVILTIIVTGNHFVLDAIAGIAVMGIGFLVAGWARRHLAARPPRSHPP